MTDKLVKQPVGLQSSQWDIIGKSTPKEYIKVRRGRGGKDVKYVEGSYIIEQLNTAFNGMWDFEVVEQGQNDKQLWVKGRLTVKFLTPEGWQTITKNQFGGSDVKGFDIADDYKAATTDALKKCASMFGIASDIYGSTLEHIEEEDPTEAWAPLDDTSSKPKTEYPETRICSQHGVSAKKYVSSDGKIRYSHAKEEGGWCNIYI